MRTILHRAAPALVVALATAGALVLPLAPAASAPVAVAASGTSSASPASPVSPASQVEGHDELAVSVVGDGTSSGNQAVPVSVQLLDGAGALGDRVALPVEAAGDQHALTLGADRDQQGALQQSADHRWVTLGGYDAEPGSGALNDTAAPDVLRVVGRVGADGTVDTSTTLADAYSVRHVRGVVTDDGERFWTGGHGHDAPTTKGGVLTVERGGDAPVPVVSGSSNLNNARVPVIHDGALYVSSDRTGFHGVNLVEADGSVEGSGLPTGPADLTLVAGAPAEAEVPHDFTFAGGALYVTYTDGAARGLAKYVEGDDGSYDHVGTYPGAFWGVTGRVAGDHVVLYAVRGGQQGNEAVRLVDDGAASGIDVVDDTVLAAAGPGEAFRGIAFAPGFVPGDEPVETGDPLPTVTWDVRVAGGVGNALSAVVGQVSNPVATGRAADSLGADLTVTATSSDQDVVRDADVAVELAPDGRFTVAPTPRAAGIAAITLTVATDDGRETTSRLDYWVSAALADPTARAYVGMSDASAAYDVGDGHLLVADDDSNEIRLFGPDGGEPVAEFDLSDGIEYERPGETHDLEAAARVGDTIYWVGSLGNTRSGNVRLDRDIVLATTVSGTGASTTLELAGYAKGVRQALVDWDVAGEHGLGADHFGFAAATAPGSSAEGPNSLNVEGAAIAPDGTTLWLGLRSPLVPLPDGGEALLVGIPDIEGVVTGDAEPHVGEAITLDLGGRAVRDLERTDDGQYLIIAGSADDAGDFAVFGWTGDPADAPVQAVQPPALAGWPGSYESVATVPSLADGTVVRLLQDAGTVDVYGNGTQAQDLPATELKKFVGHDYTLDLRAAFTEKSLALGAAEVRAGDELEVLAAGFAAAEELVLELRSEPVVLLEAEVGPDGSLAARVVVPAGTEPGEHTLVARAGSGEARATLVVTAAVPDGAGPGSGSGDRPADGEGTDGPSTGRGPDGLATTGVDAGTLALAAAVLGLLGAGLVGWRARVRTRRASSEV